MLKCILVPHDCQTLCTCCLVTVDQYSRQTVTLCPPWIQKFHLSVCLLTFLFVSNVNSSRLPNLACLYFLVDLLCQFLSNYFAGHIVSWTSRYVLIALFFGLHRKAKQNCNWHCGESLNTAEQHCGRKKKSVKIKNFRTSFKMF